MADAARRSGHDLLPRALPQFVAIDWSGPDLRSAKALDAGRDERRTKAAVQYHEVHDHLHGIDVLPCARWSKPLLHLLQPLGTCGTKTRQENDRRRKENQ